MGNHITFYSRVKRKYAMATAIVIMDRLMSSVIDFTAINDRLCSIKLPCKWYNLTVLLLLIYIEDAEKTSKNQFYKHFEQAVGELPNRT